MKLKNVALNEKGNLKPAVRKVVVDHIVANPDLFCQAEKVEGKNAFVLPITDSEGNVFYANFDLSISVKPAYERAEKKVKPKTSKEAEAIEIE